MPNIKDRAHDIFLCHYASAFFGLLLICDIPLKRPRAGLEHLKMCKAKVFMEDSGMQ